MLTDVITVIKSVFVLILKRQLVSNMKQCVQIDINSLFYSFPMFTIARERTPFQGNISNV